MKIRRIEPAIRYTNDGTTFDTNANLNGKFVNTIIFFLNTESEFTYLTLYTHIIISIFTIDRMSKLIA